MTPTEQQEKPITDCRPADLVTAQKECEAAFHAPAWAECATRVIVKPLLLGCTYKLCEFGGLNHLLCEALQAFGAACEAQGLKPPIWRNSSFCRECPLWSPQNCSQALLPSVYPLKLLSAGSRPISDSFMSLM